MMILSILQYQDAVENCLSPRQIETLQILYSMPNSSATAKQLAEELNYSSYRAANRQIGQIGKAILLFIKEISPVYHTEHEIQTGYYRLIGEYERPKGWVMRDNLKKALENLKLVNKDKNDLETLDRLSTELNQFEETNLFHEGKAVQVFINRYERNIQARLNCIRHYGNKCSICNFDFGEFYGEIAIGYIHVHHKLPLSEIKEAYKVDPINDLIPVCANCHSVIHLTKPAMTVEEIKERINEVFRNKLKETSGK